MRIHAGLIPYRIKNGELQVFLQRRSFDARWNPDGYGFWGGGIEAGETPEQALQREIKEELNFDLPSGVVYLGYFDNQERSDGAYRFALAVDDSFEDKITVLEGQYGEWFSREKWDHEEKLPQDFRETLTMLVKKLTPEHAKGN